MRLVIATLLISLLCVAPVFAEFTDQEKAESLKFILGSEDYLDGMSATANLTRRDGSEAYADKTADVLGNLVAGHHVLMLSFAALLDSSEQVAPGNRVGMLAEMEKALDNAIGRLNGAISKAQTLPVDPAVIVGLLVNAKTHLESFDRTLTYAEPRLLDPTDGSVIEEIASPHGAHGRVIRGGFKVSQYIRNPLQDWIFAYRTDPINMGMVSPTVNDVRIRDQGCDGSDLSNCSQLTRNATGNLFSDSATFLHQNIRYMGLVAGIALPKDQAKVDKSFNQGTTPRGDEFFELNLMNGIAMNANNGFTDAFGISYESGMTTQLAEMINQWAAVMNEIDGPEVRRRLGLGINDLGDAWRRMDRMDWFSRAFFKVPGAFASNACDFCPVAPCDPCNPDPAPEVIVDNADPNTSQTGTWLSSSGASPWDGGSVYCNFGCTFTWLPSLSEAGDYEVFVWWTDHKNRSATVPYTVHHAGGDTTIIVNQQDNDLDGQWNSLGVFTFLGDGSGSIEVSSENGQANADAIRLVKQ